MKFEAELEAETKSECRALVPLTVTADDRARGYSLADAAFVTQLAANKKGFSHYRAKRRVKPEIGAKNYRTTIAAALAFQPMGRKLNYCA
jgi:hypothetical protein